MGTEWPHISAIKASHDDSRRKTVSSLLFDSPKAAPAARREYVKLVRATASIVMLLSGASLAALLIDLASFGPMGPLSEPMTPGAATAFFLLGMLLHLAAADQSILRPPADRKHKLIQGLAATVLVVGVATLIHYVVDLRSMINAASPQAFDRMSLVCAHAVLALGAVFLLRDLRLVPLVREWLALGCFVVGYLALMGYVYDAKAFYQMGATAIPVPSALCVLMVAGAFLLLPPHYGLMRVVVSRGPGGLLVRRLLPVALFVAPAVDYVQTKVGDISDSNMALVGLANVVLLLLLIWGTGRAVQIAQAHRRQAEESAKAMQERLLLSLEAAGGGAWDLDLVHGDAWWSPEMYRLWRVPRGNPIELEHSLELIDPRDREHVMRSVRTAIEGRTPYECEFRLRNDGSGERWMASRGRVHYDAFGTPTRLIGISVDISSRKAAEILLRQTNEALARSNVELQRFAHVAAHDLQTPLRGIGSFAELLKVSYRDQLADRGREWLDRILTSTRHLHSLIRDLLEYSSVDTQPLAVQAVSLDEVLERVFALLDAEIRGSGCVITRDALPVVSGEFTQLVQVFFNLIGNALKYRSSNVPEVHIAADRIDGMWRISVRDNGIGIDVRHAGRIFDMFERLHDAREYPGTGIGLALCRRVVQRHGGSIWVESGLGRGSTFFFTLPAEG